MHAYLMIHDRYIVVNWLGKFNDHEKLLVTVNQKSCWLMGGHMTTVKDAENWGLYLIRVDQQSSKGSLLATIQVGPQKGE